MVYLRDCEGLLLLELPLELDVELDRDRDLTFLLPCCLEEVATECSDRAGDELGPRCCNWPLEDAKVRPLPWSVVVTLKSYCC